MFNPKRLGVGWGGCLGTQNFAATATDAQLGPAGLDNLDGSKNGAGLILQVRIASVIAWHWGWLLLEIGDSSEQPCVICLVLQFPVWGLCCHSTVFGRSGLWCLEPGYN